MKPTPLVHAVAVSVAASLSDPRRALAATNTDWVKPGIDLFARLEGGLVDLGIILVGVGMVAVGLWAGLVGRLDFMRVVMIVLAGLLIVAGPAAIRALLA